MITFTSRQINFTLKGKNLVRSWINGIIKERGYKAGEINIVFLSDNDILELNNSALGHNYYTDIITFDLSEGIPDGKIYSDLYISIDTVLANSQTYRQHSSHKFECELCRVMIHGILHLTGEDDVTSSKQKRMRAAENKALASIIQHIDSLGIECKYKPAQ